MSGAYLQPRLNTINLFRFTVTKLYLLHFNMCTLSRDTCPFDQIRFLKPLAAPTLVGQVYEVSAGDKVYAAKLVRLPQGITP